MATPNYSYEKRQRELAKKRKAEEKKQRKAQGRQDGGDASDAAPADETGDPATGAAIDSPPPAG